MAKKFMIEEAFLELDRILETMQKEDISLSESMELYKKGVKLLEKCSDTLDKTEKEIMILQEEPHA